MIPPLISAGTAPAMRKRACLEHCCTRSCSACYRGLVLPGGGKAVREVGARQREVAIGVNVAFSIHQIEIAAAAVCRTFGDAAGDAMDGIVETITHAGHSCQVTPLRTEIEARTGASLTEATAACEAAIARRFGAGPVDGKIQAHVAMVAR